MTRAYQEIYLSKAQSVIGDAFDYAVNTCNILGTDFVKLFIASSVSKRMENGEPAYLAGKSGIEIVREIVAETKGKELQIEPQEHFRRSKVYWIGWLLPIISGIQAGSIAIFLKCSLLNICKKCTTPSMKRISQNLSILWIQK